MPERLIVIGGDAAGMSAASQARRRRGPGDPWDPVLIAARKAWQKVEESLSNG